MKKVMLISLVFLTIMLMSNFAVARTMTYSLYLGNSASGETVTVASGTSVMVLEGNGYVRSEGRSILADADALPDGMYSLQMSAIDTLYDITSGATYTIRWQESDIDTTAAWADAEYNDIVGFLEMPMSGETLEKHNFRPNASQHLRFSFISGTTSFNGIKIKLRIREPLASEYNKPVTLPPEAIYVSSTTVFSLSPPDTAMTALMQVENGPIRFVLDGSTPENDNDTFLSSGDWYNFWSRYEIDGFKCIMSSGGSGATVYVHYFGNLK